MRIFTPAHPAVRFRWLDAVLFGFVFLLLYVVFRLGMGMTAAFSPTQPVPFDLSPENLPYYAGRSLLRMFLALAASLVFTFVYGYLAAKNRWAKRILIPLLDILQSVPVLGFLSATIGMFLALFPGRLLGVECAAVFAIFTSQVWNMTFSFYQSMQTIPKDLQEAARMLHLNAWQRFWQLELPQSMMGLIWNGMMSFGGAWFFLAASEAISVWGTEIHLPGVGSYMAAAIAAGNIRATFEAMVTMLVLVFCVDQLFWRPLTVWGQKFKSDFSTAAVQPDSFVYDLLQRSVFLPMFWQRVIHPFLLQGNQIINRFVWRWGKTISARENSRGKKALQLVVFCGAGLWFLKETVPLLVEIWDMLYVMGPKSLEHVFFLGFLTALRVFAALLLGAVWAIPLGVKIGLNPRLSGHLQPLVQMAASFPANMLFPFLTVFFICHSINFAYGSVLFMVMGTQWYILFNVIAGAMSIPNDLLEAARIFKIQGWKKWRLILLPGIFPQLVIGLLTASGGAWNASIVSECVGWKDQILTAQGLGSYINAATVSGDWQGLLVGVLVMCFWVVGIHRLIWQRFEHLAVTKYHWE